MAKILSISYDPRLLLTRELLLRQMGHSVISAEGFAKAVELCDQASGTVDLVVLGHSITLEDKRAIIRRCNQTCPCPVLVLTRINEPAVTEATRSIDPSDTREFMAAVRELLRQDRADKAQE